MLCDSKVFLPHERYHRDSLNFFGTGKGNLERGNNILMWQSGGLSHDSNLSTMDLKSELFQNFHVYLWEGMCGEGERKRGLFLWCLSLVGAMFQLLLPAGRPGRLGAWDRHVSDAGVQGSVDLGLLWCLPPYDSCSFCLSPPSLLWPCSGRSGQHSDTHHPGCRGWRYWAPHLHLVGEEAHHLHPEENSGEEVS